MRRSSRLRIKLTGKATGDAMGLLGFGSNKERTLAGLKRRAKVGCTLTMIANQLHGSDMAIPDPILGIPRYIVSVSPDGLLFDPRGPGGHDRSTFLWPRERQVGFLGMIASPSGDLAGFADDDTFIVDYQVYYSVFRLGN